MTSVSSSPSVNVEKLHLGCGVKHIPGYFHVDALPLPHVDHVGPVDKLEWIGNDQVSTIYACHVLEHFGRREVASVLKEWFRVLKPGGILRLAVPNFAAAAKLYMERKLPNGIVGVMGLVSGGQRDQYDFHKIIFDEEFSTGLLKDAGFQTVRLWDWRNTDHAWLDDYSQAYLPHMDKENGVLVSLNIEAVK